jgi:hypothetical protein
VDVGVGDESADVEGGEDGGGAGEKAWMSRIQAGLGRPLVTRVVSRSPAITELVTRPQAT